MNAEAMLAEMERINQIAQTEKDTNVPILQAGLEFWNAVATELERSHQALSTAASQVAEHWQDTTHPIAFGQPVEAGVDSMAKSVQTIMQANPQLASQNAIDEIEKRAEKIAELFEQFLMLKELADNLRAAAAGDPMGFEAQMIAQLEAKMRELVDRAIAELKLLDEQGYGQAVQPVRTAGAGHAWNGPRSVSAASTSGGTYTASTATVDGSGTATASTFEGDIPGTTPAPDPIQPGGDANAGEHGQQGESREEGAQDQPTESGLAGGPATAPAPPMTNVPPAAPPAGPGGPGMGGVPIAPVAGALGRGVGPTGPVMIPRAAKVSGGIVSAGVGKPPALPSESAAGASAVRKPAAVGPMGAGIPPMLGAPLAAGSLQSLISKLKPIVGRQLLAPAPKPESVPGVPRGLRGRTARTQDDEAFRLAPRPQRNRRSSSTENQPETVQLLDEEIWQVQQARQAQPGSASNPAVAVHR